MRKAEEVHKVLTQANQQDKRANERRQEPDDGEEVQGQGVAEPGDEPDNAVLREVGDDQQLREGNVEHAEYEEGTDGSRVPLQYEGNRNCEKQHQRHGHEEEVNPVAAERGQVGNVLELGFVQTLAGSLRLGTLELILERLSLDAQGFAGIRNLLMLHLNGSIERQTGGLAKPGHGDGCSQNHLNQGHATQVVPVDGGRDDGEDSGQQRDRGNV